MNALQQKGAPTGVQLGNEFIQQQDGLILGDAAHPRQFCQLQGEDSRACLPARAVQAQIAPVDREAQFIALRSDQGDAARHFLTLMLSERLAQLRGDLIRSQLAVQRYASRLKASCPSPRGVGVKLGR